MLEKFSKSPFLHLFKKAITEETSLLFEGLWNCPKAILTLTAFHQLNSSILIITGGERQDKLLDDLNYFSPQECLEFLSWETLPSEEIAPSLDIIGKRFDILHRIAHHGSHHIVVTNLQGCLQKILPKKELTSYFHTWKVGTKLSFSKLPTLLASLGYTRHPVTSDKGEYSLRGGILDVFPVSALTPYRIEFFDDEIDRIRSFDPTSQKSIEKVSSLFLAPANECLLLKQASSLSTLFDYFEKPPLIIFDDLLALEDKYVALKSLPGMNSQHFLDFETLFDRLKNFRQLYFSSQKVEELYPILAREKKRRSFYSGENPLQGIVFDMFHQQLATKRMQDRKSTLLNSSHT